MSALFLVIGCGLLPVLVISTFIQTLYMESMRLRARENPAMRWFKGTLEAHLGLDSERGFLTFSLIKHVSIGLAGILIFEGLLLASDDRQTGWLQAAGISIPLMVLATYIVAPLLSRRTSGEWLTPLLPFLTTLVLIMRPFTGLLRFLESILDLAHEKEEQQEANTASEDIDALIEAGREEGLIEEDDTKLIQSVVKFGDKVVREVMTPRPNVVAVDVKTALEGLRQLVIHEQYSRIPVFEETIDQIIGFVHVRDMFELDEDDRTKHTVRELMRPIRFVPESKPVSDLMREMQQAGAHMVVVVDEYGNTAGVCTMEDLVEVLVGEIRDEHEPASDLKSTPDGGYLISGSFDLARLGELFDFEPDEEIESTTVGGLVSEWLGRVPKPGEVVERDGLRIEIIAGNELRINEVKITRTNPVPQSSRL